MELNPNKTKLMRLNFSKQHPMFFTSPRLDSIDVHPVAETKLLGVWITSDLRWNLHISNITKKASKRLFLLNRLKGCGIKEKHLLRVYLEFVRPVLEYASPLWHSSLPLTLSQQVEAIQQRAVRTIMFPKKNVLQASTFFTKTRNPPGA